MVPLNASNHIERFQLCVEPCPSHYNSSFAKCGTLFVFIWRSQLWPGYFCLSAHLLSEMVSIIPLVVIITLLAVCKTCIATYRLDVPTFHVGSNIFGKSTPHCPCTELNSTLHRACGVAPKVNRMNVSDNETHFGEFPWQVAIIEKYEEDFVCSGVLVSPKVVLTAAHCVQEIPVSQIKVRVGEWDILSEDKNPFEAYGSVDIQVSKKYLNTESRTLNEVYNLAILKLISAVNFDEYPHVGPICLPQINTGKTNLSDCVVTGWGESGVQKLEKLIERHVGKKMSHAIGIWTHPLESTESNTKYPERNSHCQLFGSTLQDQIQCLSEYRRIPGMDNQSQQERDDQFEGESVNDEDETDDNIFSRILAKSRAKVLQRAECLRILKEINSTLPKANQLCVAAIQGSSPCLGDIGSPVVCRVVEEKKPNPKEMRRYDEESIKYAVVGIVTQSYKCKGDGNGKDVRPLLATSISKSLDQICHVISSN